MKKRTRFDCLVDVLTIITAAAILSMLATAFIQMMEYLI